MTRQKKSLFFAVVWSITDLLSKKEAGKCYTYKSRDVENEVNGLWPSKRKITYTYTSGNFCQWVAHKGFLEHALPENMRGLWTKGQTSTGETKTVWGKRHWESRHMRQNPSRKFCAAKKKKGYLQLSSARFSLHFLCQRLKKVRFVFKLCSHLLRMSFHL